MKTYNLSDVSRKCCCHCKYRKGIIGIIEKKCKDCSYFQRDGFMYLGSKPYFEFDPKTIKGKKGI